MVFDIVADSRDTRLDYHLVPMKRLLLPISLVLFASPAIAQSITPADKPAPAVAPAKPAAGGMPTIDFDLTTPEAKKGQEEFNKLSAAKQEEFFKLMTDGEKFMGERRIPEALQKFNDAESIWPKHPSLMNIKGSALVNLRDFERAGKYFDECARLYPGFWQAHFNAAEMKFVQKKWEAAEKEFRALLDMDKSIEGPTRKLVEYKIILSMIKLKKTDEAKKMINKYDIFDDSPLFYYANAALNFEADNRKAAEEWVTNARAVYNAQVNAIFEDSLSELGWLFVF